MIKIILSFLITLLVLSSSTVVSAEDSSASGEVAGTSTASDSASLTSKLKDLESQIASKAAQLKTEMSNKLQNKAYFGVITDIADQKITIESTLNNQHIVVNEYTDFTLPVKKGKKPQQFTVKDLSKGDFVSTLGDIDDNNVLTAKKLIKSDPIATDSAKFVWGQVLSANNNAIALNTKDNQKLYVYTSAQTDFFLGTNDATFSDIKTNKYLVGKGTTDKEGNIHASYIYIIPSQGEIKPVTEKVSSPSATPTASASAKATIAPKKK